MQKSHRKLRFLLFSILSFTALSLVIYFIPPDQSFRFSTVSLSVVPLFFMLTFLFLFSLGTYLFKNTTHGILIALIVIVYLLFRQNNLTHPFFALLLAALFLVLELLFTYKK